MRYVVEDEQDEIVGRWRDARIEPIELIKNFIEIKFIGVNKVNKVVDVEISALKKCCGQGTCFHKGKVKK